MVGRRQVSNARAGLEMRRLTFTDDLALDIPFTKDGEEKGKRIDDGHRQAQFCKG